MNSGFEKLLSAAGKHKGGIRTRVAKESCHREGRAERGMSYSSGVLRQNKRKRHRSVSIKHHRGDEAKHGQVGEVGA